MTDKILYTGGPNPFKGLIGMPEEPTTNLFNSSLDAHMRAWKAYDQQVESIKSNAPDIVNPEILNYARVSNGNVHINCYPKEGFAVKPGDIFDLPVGYEFKKVELPDCVDNKGFVEVVGFGRVHKNNFPYLCIVKTEVKEESQKELWEEITAIILGSEDDMEITRNKIMKQFLIQRKEMTEYKDEIMFKNFYI